jgi:DNA-binding NarL/FixJ family response regulator
LVLEGLQKILEPEFEVTGMVEDGRALVSAAAELKPDAILLDISMPGLNGIDAAYQLRKGGCRARLIFVTMHTEQPFVVAAFRAGAAGYIPKHSTPNQLLAAVRAVIRGEDYVAPGLGLDVRKLSKQFACRASPAPEFLTSRQREILQLVAEGKSNKEIAAVLDLSVKAVEFHRSAIARRLGTRKTAEWTRYAAEHGLIGP